MSVLENPVVPRTMQYTLTGRGITVTVDGAWARAHVVERLTQLACDLLIDVQAEAEQAKDEAAFLRAEAVRSLLTLSAGECSGLVSEPRLDPPALVEGPLDLECPSCGAGAGQPCLDQRMGRAQRPMSTNHPERVQAYRDRG